MLLEFRQFSIAKDSQRPDENQDAVAVDLARGIGAIADGASSSLFAGPWARLLVNAVVAEPPEIDDADALAAWLGEQRAEWLAGIDPSTLAWHQKPKLADGAFATLLWIELTADDEDANELRLRAVAVGDCSLFHVRQLRVHRVFPLESSELFGVDPALIGSSPRQAIDSIAFDTLEDTCLPGDLLVLCTDAVAAWALARLESGGQPTWESLWEMEPDDFCRWIDRLRREQQIRFDDSTVALIRISAEPGSQPSAAAREEEEEEPTLKEQLGRWAGRVPKLSSWLKRQDDDESN